MPRREILTHGASEEGTYQRDVVFSSGDNIISRDDRDLYFE